MSTTKPEHSNDAGGDALLADKTIASFKMLAIERRQRVLIIRFNRPEKRNAMNRAVYYELIRALGIARQDSGITTVVLTGIGEYFSSGLDLSQFETVESKMHYCKTANGVARLFFSAFITCPKLLVALVNGPAVGVGFTLCALCDVVYCTEKARFLAPFSRVGLCVEAASSYLFPTIMGRSKATDVLIFGRELKADEALQANFVARIFKSDELDAVFWPMMLQYAALPAESLRISKRLIAETDHNRITAALNDELNELKALRYGETFQNAVDRLAAHSKNKSKL